MNYIKNHIMPRSKLFDFVREIKKKKKSHYINCAINLGHCDLLIPFCWVFFVCFFCNSSMHLCVLLYLYL